MQNGTIRGLVVGALFAVAGSGTIALAKNWPAAHHCCALAVFASSSTSGGGGVLPIHILRTARSYGAALDGVSDDTASLNAALALGGTLLLPAGSTALISKTLEIPSGTRLLCGPGATIDFEPHPPIDWADSNDRAVAFLGQPGPSIEILGPIESGATSFVSAGAPPPMTRGQWILFRELDPGAGDNEYLDWNQISSFGPETSVQVERPFRMAFPAAKGHILSYFPIAPDHDSAIVGCTIRSAQAQVTTPGISVAFSRNISVIGNTVDMANGQGLYSYGSNSIQFRGNQVVGDGPTASEFAESTDVVIEENDFGLTRAGASPTQACANLDFGLGFFAFVGNHCLGALNISLEVLSGVHDGVIANNTFPYPAGFGLGLVALGARGVEISGNDFTGGEGSGTRGIVVDDCGTCTPAIPSAGVTVSGNSLKRFSVRVALKPGSANASLPAGDSRAMIPYARDDAATSGLGWDPPSACAGSAGFAAAASVGVGTLPNPEVSTTPGGITIRWLTAEPLNTQVWYSGPGNVKNRFEDWNLTRNHVAELSGLGRGAYGIQVESSNYSNPDLCSLPFTVSVPASNGTNPEH